MLAEDEGFIFCFVDDAEPLSVLVPTHHLSLVDWIGAGPAVLTATQVEARDILRQRRLNKEEQVDLAVMEPLVSILYSGSQNTQSQRFAQVIADHVEERRAQEPPT